MLEHQKVFPICKNTVSDNKTNISKIATQEDKQY